MYVSTSSCGVPVWRHSPVQILTRTVAVVLAYVSWTHLYVVTPESHRVARTTLKRLRFVFVVRAGFKRVGAVA